MMTTNDTPRIYVACLAAYNSGKLHGAWIDVDEWLDEDDLQEEIDKMLAKSPVEDAEEWAIHDYENLSSCIGEHSSLETVVKAAEIVSEHGEVGHKVIEYQGGNIDTAHEILDGQGYSIHDSLADYAREFRENHMDVPELPSYLEHSIDWERAGEYLTRDDIVLELSGGRIVVIG